MRSRSTSDAAMSLRLRPTMLSDLDWVVSVERDGANLPFITPWERTQHEGAIRFPDSRHFIVEEGDQLERIVFLTGGAFTTRAQTFMTHVTNAFVAKPFDVDKLLELVNSRLLVTEAPKSR